MRRTHLLVSFLLALAASLMPATAASAADGAGSPTKITLPGAAVFPEGVAWSGRLGAFFAGSTADGTIYTGTLRDDTARVLVPASARRPAVGMKVDRFDRLWVAGGSSGKVWVYDARTGALLETLDALPFVADPTNVFLNDLVVTREAVYVTDSFNPNLYRVPLDGAAIGALELFRSFDKASIGFVDGGFNFNGIVAKGPWLVVSNSAAGRLFRVTAATGDVAPVDVAGAVGPADGLVLKGTTLYAVRGFPTGAVAAIKLSEQLRRGEVRATFGDGLATPTTAARVGGRLLVVESQFGGPGVAPFQVAVLKIAR